MTTTPHLLVALSSHGYGHLAQVAPVLNELRQRLPQLRLTVQSALASTTLAQRIAGDFDHIQEATDVGMVMADGLAFKRDASVNAYADFHKGWEQHMAHQLKVLEILAPDLLLADIPYLPLAAAERAGIPAVALCSLHWSAILEGCGFSHPQLARWRSTMVAAYQSARIFLCPEPSMPMPELRNTRTIGPIAALGQDRRAEINLRLGLSQDTVLVLVALGGIATLLPIQSWPYSPGIIWLVPGAWGITRTDMREREALADIPFVDLMGSCDVVLSKPGYGTFAEAACHGKPVLYVDREDWPEAVWLVRWLQQYGNAARISKQALETAAILPTLERLLEQPRRPPVTPMGVIDAADCLQGYLLTA